jgi:hypothetical protein
MEHLPVETIVLLLSDLEVRDFLSVTSINRAWHASFSTNSDLWSLFLIRDFGVDLRKEITDECKAIRTYIDIHHQREGSSRLVLPDMHDDQKRILWLSSRIAEHGMRDILVSLFNWNHIPIVSAAIAVRNALYNPGSTTVILCDEADQGPLTNNIISGILLRSKLAKFARKQNYSTEFQNGSIIVFRYERMEEDSAWSSMKVPKKDLIIITQDYLDGEPGDDGDITEEVNTRLACMENRTDQLENYALSFTTIDHDPEDHDPENPPYFHSFSRAIKGELNGTIDPDNQIVFL